jgi:exosortase/archaeosortase family protein
MPLTGVLAITAGAFAISLASLGSRLNSTDAQSLAMLAPLAALACLVIAVVRDGPPPTPKLEPAMLGAIPAMLAALGLVVFGPGRLGFSFWYLRLDLAAMVAFGMAALMIAAGVRSVVRHGALLAAMVCLPPVTMPLATALQTDLQGAVAWAARKLALAMPLGVSPAQGDGMFRVHHGGLVSVAAQCGGLEGIAMVALIGAPVAVGTRGPARRKLLVVGVGLLAAWCLNLVRVTVLLALAGHHQNPAFRTVHSWAGVGIVAIVVGGMLLLAGRAGLRWEAANLRTKTISYTRNHVIAAVVLLAGGLVVADAGLAATAGPGLRVVDVSSMVHVLQWKADDGRTLMGLKVPGRIVRFDKQYPWFKQFFGDHSNAASFAIMREDLSHPVWTQVITARSLRSLSQYAPLDCALAHRAHIVRVRRIALPGGAAVLLDEQLRGHHFGALSWTQPVIMPDGHTGFRRVQLFADAAHGTDQRIPEARSLVEQFAYGVLNVLTPYPDSSSRGWSYGPADREIVAVAESMLTSHD